MPELNLAFQCHLWGHGTTHSPRQLPAAPSGTTQDTSRDPGSSSVPTSHTAGSRQLGLMLSPQHAPAGRDGAETDSRHWLAWQSDFYLSCQSTLCPTRSPNPNVGRKPREGQKQLKAPNPPVLRGSSSLQGKAPPALSSQRSVQCNGISGTTNHQQHQLIGLGKTTCREVLMKAEADHAIPWRTKYGWGRTGLLRATHLPREEASAAVSAQHTTLPGEIPAEDHAQQGLTT